MDGSLSAGFCLGLQVSSPSFHSPRPSFSLSLSLSLGPSYSSLSPLVFSWLVHVSVLATFVAWLVPRHFLVAYLLVSLRFYTIIFWSLFPTFLVGSSSFASLDAIPVRSSGLSGALVTLPGSLLCLLPGYRSLSSQFPVVWLVLCFLPCGPAPGLSLFGLLAVHPFLLSRFVAVCFPGLWVSLFPCRLPRPGLLFPGSHHLQLPPPWYSRWRLDPAFLLLWCASSYCLSRLVSCFCFLGLLFREFSWFQGFLSSFSALGFCRSQSCLGLQWFLVFLSIPLLGFSVNSSLCGVSRLLTWSLFLSVPSFVPVWFVLPPLRCCSAVSSCSPAFSGLADRAISLLQLSLLLCSWRLCSSCFPPSRLWSSSMAFSSVTVPLVFS